MKKKYCAASGRAFLAYPQIHCQAYLSDPKCQRERRRRWPQGKRRIDPDYRDNDARHSREWTTENPDYWRR